MPETSTSPQLGFVPGTAERTSRAQAVADRLRELISTGQVQPGDRLGTKVELQRQFSVAAGTLNEAIRLLETGGLIEARPGPRGGIFVTNPPAHIRLSHLILSLGSDAMSVSDSFEIRNALELPVALQAARNATREQLLRLDEIVGAMAGLGEEPAAYLARNWDLHEEIARISVNPLLKTIYVSLLETAREAVRDVAPDPAFRDSFPHNLQMHRELVGAIASGEPERVRRAVEAHTPLSEALTGRAGG